MREKRPLSLAFPRGETVPVWAILFSGLVASVLGIGNALMIISTYPLEVDSFGFVFFLPIFAFGFSYIHARKDIRLNLIVLGGILVLFGLSLFLDLMAVQSAAANFVATIQYYAISFLPAGDAEGMVNPISMTLFLVFLSSIPLFVTTWVLVRKRWIGFAILAYLPFLVCTFSLNYRYPSTGSGITTMLGFLMLFIAGNVRKSAKEKTYQDMLKVMTPLVVILIVLAIINPQKRYSQDELARKYYFRFQNYIEMITNRIPWGTGASLDPQMRPVTEATYSGSVVMEDLANQVLTMSVDNENLLNAGNFGMPKWKFMTVTRMKNDKYTGDATKGNRYMYLKTSSMDRFDGRSWASAEEPLNYSDYYPSRNVKEKESQYIVFVSTEFSGDYAFIPYYVDHYHVDPESETILLSSSELTVKDSHNINEKVKQDPPLASYIYSYDGVPVRYTPKWSEAYLDNIYTDDLFVPSATREGILYSGMLPDWYMKVLSGENDWSTEQIVRGVVSYVSTLNTYDDNTGFPPTDKDFVTWFMRESKTGFCVHYASTAVVLLRLAGIPARYVKGYFLTDVEDGVPCDVYSTDAHAWIEYFHHDYGWIMDDPTPGNQRAASFFNFEAITKVYGPETTMVTPRPKDTRNGALVPATSDSAQKSGTTTDTEAPVVKENRNFLLTFFERAFDLLVWILIGMAIVVALFLGTRFVFQYYWKKRFAGEDLNENSRAYYKYYRTMAKFLKGPPSESGVEIAQKATFSREGISQEELLALISKEEKNLDMLYAKANVTRKNLFDAFKIRKKLPL